MRSTLVEVPVLLKAKGGEVVFGLTADDFLVTDNGVPQRLTLDQDTRRWRWQSLLKRGVPGHDILLTTAS